MSHPRNEYNDVLALDFSKAKEPSHYNIYTRVAKAFIEKECLSFFSDETEAFWGHQVKTTGFAVHCRLLNTYIENSSIGSIGEFDYSKHFLEAVHHAGDYLRQYDDSLDFQVVSERQDSISNLNRDQKSLSELINLSRQLADAREEILRLRQERDNPALQDNDDECVLLRKAHYGVVTSVIGKQAEVSYTISGQKTVKQIYHFDDLKTGKSLAIGDALEACVVLRKSTRIPDTSIDREFEEIDEYQSGSAKGKIRF